MINNDLINYIKNQKQAGLNNEQIKEDLLKSGWQEANINDGLNFIAKQPLLPFKKLALIVSAVLLILAGGAFTFFYLGNKATNQLPPQTSNTETKNTTVSSSPNIQEAEKIKQSVVLFNSTKGSPEITTTFISDPDRQNMKELPIYCRDQRSGTSLKDSYYCSTSKDGLYLASWNDKKIRISSSKNLSSFETITEIKNSDENIKQLIWSNDDSVLIYKTSKDAGPRDGPYQPTDNKIMLVAREGTRSETLKESRDLNISLQGLNLYKNELYWFELGNWEMLNFTIFDLSNKTIKKVDESLAVPGNFAFSSDFSKIYYISNINETSRGNKIEEYTIDSGTKKVFYENKNIGQDENGNKSFILNLDLSPNDGFLVFSVVNEPDEKVVSYSLKLPDGQIEALADNPPDNLIPVSFSPDGKYLWLETEYLGNTDIVRNKKYYVMDMETKKIKLFFGPITAPTPATGEQMIIPFGKETINFLSWLMN